MRQDIYVLLEWLEVPNLVRNAELLQEPPKLLSIGTSTKNL